MDTLERKVDLWDVAEIQLSYQTKVKASVRPKVTCSRQVYEVLPKHWGEGSMEFVKPFKVLLLSRDNRVLGITTISIDRTAGTLVDAKMVYVAAIKATSNQIKRRV